eukprot:2009641-Rhodomonas_salina.2
MSPLRKCPKTVSRREWSSLQSSPVRVRPGPSAPIIRIAVRPATRVMERKSEHAFRIVRSK